MRLLKRLALRFVLLTIRRPITTLVIVGIILAGCALLGKFRLPITSQQDSLFSPKVAFFRDYLEFVRLFPENDGLYLILEPADPARPPTLERWSAAADALAAKMGSLKDHVTSASAGIPVKELGEQGLMFEDPKLVPKRVEEVKGAGLMVKVWAEKPDLLTGRLGSSPGERFLGLLNASRMLSFLGAGSADADAAPLAAEVARGWDAALARPNDPLRSGVNLPDLLSLGATTPRDLGYNYVPDQTDSSKSLLLVQIYPKYNYSSLTGVSETVDVIRAAAAETMKAYPEFKLGVTGRPALDADEMRTTDHDSTLAEIFALSAVFVGLVIMLRSIWLAIAAEICLGVGIGFTFGWASISVGELNLLSLVFLIALIGIGMDYLVQILSRYRKEAARRGSPRTIWVSVLRQVAAPITTACMGAAGAFLVSIFTPFKGAADLGVIAGGGLLLCLLSGYIVLPALLTAFAKCGKKPGGAAGVETATRAQVGSASANVRSTSAEKTSAKADPTWKRLRSRTPHSTAFRKSMLLLPAVWIVALLAMLPFILQAKFDPGLLGLQAPNLESVRLVQKLQGFFAVVLSKDPEVLRKASNAIADLPLVERTEGIVAVLDNSAYLKAHADDLPKPNWTDPAPMQPGDVTSLIATARSLAARYESIAPRHSPAETTALRDAAGALRAFADRAAAEVSAGRGDAVAARLSQWQSAFIPQLRDTLRQFNPGPPDMARIPQPMRSHFVAADGTFILYIYPKHDLWVTENLVAFSRDVEERLAKVPGVPVPTGIAINVYHSTQDVRDSFLHATAYALILIVTLVLIDLRRLDQTLLAFSVLAMGLPMLVGLMGLTGTTWNFANFFALPILLGAGHEYGVFMVHRYREALKDPRRGWRGWDVSDWALLMCAYVTTAAFGFFWLLAHHRGLKSLGLVMALGIACIYLATIAVLRPILKSRLARRDRVSLGHVEPAVAASFSPVLGGEGRDEGPIAQSTSDR